MKTLAWLVVASLSIACSFDIGISDLDLGPLDVPAGWLTTVVGTVYLGSQPMQGHPAVVDIFQPLPDTIVYFGGTTIDQSTGAYGYAAEDSLICPALADGLFVQVRYWTMAADGSYEASQPSQRQPWVVPDSLNCHDGATLKAKDIVIPLPEDQPTG